VLLADRCYLEAPRWRSDGLYVSDIQADEVLKVSLDGSASVVAAKPDLSPSGLGWSKDGSLIVVSVRSMELYRVAPAALEMVADLGEVATCITNDMVVDHYGHAFVGQAGANVPAGETAPPSPLVRVDPDWSVHRAADDLVCANGMVVADHGCTLLVAETFRDRVTAFELSADGELGERSIWAELPSGSSPDGICLDEEGALWVACPFVERFVRLERGGTVKDVIEVSGRRAIACALGGERGTTFFMVTVDASDDMSALGTTRPSRIETVEVGVPGVQQP
jgi:sugar lactone lactonase YvrE